MVDTLVCLYQNELFPTRAWGTIFIKLRTTVISKEHESKTCGEIHVNN